MSQQKNNQKVVCNMYNLAPILVSNFPLLLLPTGSPLMKLWQFWPFQSPPDHPKCYLTAKSSPQPSIHIFRKSKKKLATFPIDFFRGIAKVWEGGHFTPPPPHQIGLNCSNPQYLRTSSIFHDITILGRFILRKGALFATILRLEFDKTNKQYTFRRTDIINYIKLA